MPWLPIGSQPTDAERPESEAGPFKLNAIPAVEPGAVPSANDLSAWEWDQHQLDSDVAAELGFSFATGRAGRQSRTVIAEFSRSRTISTNGVAARFGIAARLIVKVVGFDANANLTLPFVAAKAQISDLEAYASVRLEGYVGPNASDLFPQFGTFDVENYVRLVDALNKMKAAVGGQPDMIRPTQLWVLAESHEAAAAARLSTGVGTAWGLTEIADGRTCDEALAAYREKTDDTAHTAIRQTYGDLVGDDTATKPDETARARARAALEGYELHKPLFG